MSITLSIHFSVIQNTDEKLHFLQNDSHNGVRHFLGKKNNREREREVQSPSLLGTVMEDLWLTSRGVAVATVKVVMVVRRRASEFGLLLKTTEGGDGRRWCLMVDEREEGVG